MNWLFLWMSQPHLFLSFGMYVWYLGSAIFPFWLNTHNDLPHFKQCASRKFPPLCISQYSSDHIFPLKIFLLIFLFLFIIRAQPVYWFGWYSPMTLFYCRCIRKRAVINISQYRKRKMASKNTLQMQMGGIHIIIPREGYCHLTQLEFINNL